MIKKNYRMLAVLLCMAFLFGGCTKMNEAQQNTKEPDAETVEVESEEDSEVRAAFTEIETVTETDVLDTESEEASEIETTETESVEPTEPETEELQAIQATSDTYDYVALGNSITCNEISDLWWGNWGMAASSEDKDYIHLVSAWLGGQSVRPVTTTVLDLKKWELTADRDGILKDYEEYFNEYTDLITIQTGENITEFKETLGSDYPNLIKMIKEKAPNAQIIMLGEVLWPSEDIETAKRQACEQYGVTFADMSEFLNGYEGFYKSSVGTTVTGADGGSHVISDEVVAAHPNDEGMACIAQQVINHISIQN